MRAVRLLQAQGLAFHVITVLTEAALDDPERLFEFYVRNRIADVGFNLEEIESANTRSSLASAGVERPFRPSFWAPVMPALAVLLLAMSPPTGLEDVKHAPNFRTINDEVQSGVDACERTCRYFRWCGGGAPANKLYETGRFDATETMHCRLTRQAVFDAVITAIEARTAQ
jgi:sulfatase maturation enzyme AslB (radical SAM superfamily)